MNNYTNDHFMTLEQVLGNAIAKTCYAYDYEELRFNCQDKYRRDGAGPLRAYRLSCNYALALDEAIKTHPELRDEAYHACSGSDVAKLGMRVIQHVPVDRSRVNAYVELLERVSNTNMDRALDDDRIMAKHNEALAELSKARESHPIYFLIGALYSMVHYETTIWKPSPHGSRTHDQIQPTLGRRLLDELRVLCGHASRPLAA